MTATKNELASSVLSGFYRWSIAERRALLQEILQLDPSQLAALEDNLDCQQADRMVENALGVFGLPMGLCANLRINGRDRLAPMVVEEPSVVAAASYAAKLLRTGDGIQAQVSDSLMVGQVQLLDVPDIDAACRAIEHSSLDLLARANRGHGRLTAVGGGARSIELRTLDAIGPDDPLGTMLIVHLTVDVRDAMGANAINSMCEAIAPTLEDLSGGRVRLRILSNLNDRRTVTVRGQVPIEWLDGKGTAGGKALAEGIVEASVFAERDPYRAATHNKGIMNGVDAVLVATGQDWRAVEAGAHAYASRTGQYRALAHWRVEDRFLVGEMTIPMAVGVVGGVTRVHPAVKTALRIADVQTASDLAEVAAAVGLAQNLGALRALAAEGIQSGHMRLHARNVSVAAGAKGDEVHIVSERIARARRVNVDAARDALDQLRRGRAAR